MLARAWLIGALGVIGCTQPQQPLPVGTTTTTGVEIEAARTRAIDTIASECPRGSIDCGKADAATFPRARGAVPEGAAGFELGIMESTAQQKCFEANALWSTSSDDMAECSSSAGATMPFDVNLQLCEGNICRVILSEPVNDNAVQRWSVIESDLARKFGAAGERDFNVPDACMREDVLAECLQDGRARARSDWIWSTGHSASVRLTTTPSAKHAFLFVVYSAPAAARAAHIHGL